MKTNAKNQVQAGNEEAVITKTKKRTPAGKITKSAVQEKKKSVKAKQQEAKASTDEKNIKNTVKAVVTQERELFYNYPEDIDNPGDRKKFRQKVRNAIRAFERNLSKIEDQESKDYKKLNKEYQAYRKEVLMVP